jgi:hypothetical protein
MAEIEPTQFAGFPYYDDYQDGKQFIKMLFKPGYALQARELTQLQTILQKQISRFANHVFKDGSPVFDGQLGTVSCEFIRIEPTITGPTTVTVIPSQFVGKIIVNDVPNNSTVPQLRMKVLHVEESLEQNDQYHVLFIEYQNSVTVSGANGEPKNIATLKDLYDHFRDITGSPQPLTTLSVITVVDEATGGEIATDIRCQIKVTVGNTNDKIATFGKATLVSNQDGIFYIDGAFIMTPKQTIALKRKAQLKSELLGESQPNGGDSVEGEWTRPPGENFSSDEGWVFITGSDVQDLVGVRLFQFPSSRVGFTIKREVIDADADKTLLDPAYGSYNYAAPGSDRYKVDLILDHIPFTNQDSLADADQYKTNNFVELTRVIDGEIRYSVKYPIYSDLEQTLARRTYDESGSYTVKPFEIDIEEYFNSEKTCVIRKKVRQIEGSTESTPFTVIDNLGSADIETGFPANISVYGFRGGYQVWKGIVSNVDTFLARQGEIDFRSDGYGTTLMFMIFGTPEEGDIMVSESYKLTGNSNNFFLKSKIPLAGEMTNLYHDKKVLSQQDPMLAQDYLAVFPHITTVSDSRFNGKYTLGRLYPEWATSEGDPQTSDVINAINDAESKLVVGVGTGKAYIYGYEFENQNTKFIPVSKARDSEQINGEGVNLFIGNYVICEQPLTGDTSAPPYLKLPAWSSHPKVELWDELTPNGGASSESTLIGTARIRGVTSNQNNNDNVNVHLCDVQIKDNKFFPDFDSIRFRYQNVTGNGDNYPITGSLQLFKIALTGNGAGANTTVIDGVSYYDTVLFSPNENSAVFDLPSLCSLKEITEFAKADYDCKKSFTKMLLGTSAGPGSTFNPESRLKWKQYGSGDNLLWILSNHSGVGIVANTANTSPDTEYTFKASVAANSGFQSTLNAAIGTSESAYYEADNLDSILLFNANTNRMLRVGDSNSDSLIKAVVNANKKIMYIVYKPGAENPLQLNPQDNFHMETVVAAKALGQANTINFRKKTASVVSEYNTEGIWNKYFNADGYLMIPLQNWNGIFTFNDTINSDDPWNVNFNPEGENGWNLWTGDDDSGNNNTNGFINDSLPEEYITSLGFSDVLSIDEVLVWDRGNSTGKRDITNYFQLINGTNDNFYDHAKIVIRKSALQELKSGNNTIFKNEGDYLDYTLFVRFKFLKHSGSGPFTIESYNHDDHHSFFRKYENIPVYTSPIYGFNFELRNCLDYRPSRENSTPARVATALFQSVNVTNVTGENRPNALDEDCPLRDNSLVHESTGTFNPRNSRGDSETVLPALGPNGSRPAISYEYFISRSDKVVLLKDRNFQVVQGKPAIRPESPKDVPESMSLYTISLPQYTFNPEDVIVNYIDNKRYTMNDIAKLEKRIERVEYYTTLSLLEKEAAELSIPDSALGGAERVKNGIFVDNFKGHGVGDVFSPYYSCSMDFEKGHLRPRFRTRHIEFEPEVCQNTNPEECSFKISSDGVITLNYDEENPNRYIVQPVANRAISVNPFDIVSWLGSTILSPSSDTWIDTKTNPAVKINLEGENDAWEGMRNAFGTQWNDWETTWSGTPSSTTEVLSNSTNERLLASATSRAIGGRRDTFEVTRTRSERITETTERGQTREGIRTTINPQRITRDLGDRVVDVSVVPFIRAKEITITGKSLKPNTILYAFFDNILVNKYCTFNGNAVTPSNPIKTDSTGEVEIKFNIPDGVFKTGERQFRLTDSPTNDLPKSNTSADASYFAQGILQTKENTIVSTRVPVVTREAVTDERVIRDAITRTNTTTTTSNETRLTPIRWSDPLAQTFLVDAFKSPKGVWVHSIDIFIKNKPSGDSAPPIRVQIRPTVNGYPHSSVTLPFAEAVLNADEVKIATGIGEGGVPSIDDDRTYTRFKFSTPVYLLPGEYAIVIMSNSAEYECYIAEMGEVAIGSEGTRITQQPYAGVFFKSQNASTWSADQNTDLMFTINTCKFRTNPNESLFEINFSPVKSKQYGFDPNPNKNDYFEVDMMKIISQLLKFDGSTIDAKLIINNTEISVPLNENFAPRPKSLKFDKDTKLRLLIKNTDQDVSPCIDFERLSAILIDNIIDAETSDQLQIEHKARPPYQVDDVLHPVSRYISRRVDLNSGLECDDLKVYLTANLPNFTLGTENIKTSIQVWAKIQTTESDVPFDDLNWMKMEVNPLQATQIATDEITFSEYSFSIPSEFYPQSGIPTNYDTQQQQFTVPFSRYAIKIVLYSNNGTYVPVIKDLRVIAVV